MSARILVCDDDPTFRQLISTSLTMEGYQVVTAEDGEDALESIGREVPDLIILDVLMPKISGIDFCRKVRAEPETALVPVIMLSNLSSVDDTVLGLHAGADQYISKPVDFRELSVRIAALLDRTRLLRSSIGKLSGTVLAFIGAKGGVGATTVAANMAALLAAERSSVIIAEIQPVYGTLAAQFGIRPKRGLFDLMESHPASITQANVESCLYSVPPEMRVLFGPQKPDEFGELDIAKTSTILNHLISMADYTLVDLPHAASGATEVVIKSSTTIFLMVEPELASVSAATVQLQQMDLWGIGRANVKVVVVNRQGTLLLSLREMENRLDHPISGVAPPAMEALSVSIQFGKPLAQYQPEHLLTLSLTDVLQRHVVNRSAASH